MRKSLWIGMILAAFLALPAPSAAQEFPRYEFFGGYAYTRLSGRNCFGWHASGSYSLNRYLGIVMDAGRLGSSTSDSANGITYERNHHSYVFMAGPQVSYRGTGKLTPFAHFLLGGATSSYSDNYIVDGVSYPNALKVNEFAMELGGGIDVRWKGPLSFRPQAEYMGLRVPGTAFTTSYWNKGWRLSLGMTLRVGHRSE